MRLIRRYDADPEPEPGTGTPAVPVPVPGPRLRLVSGENQDLAVPGSGPVPAAAIPEPEPEPGTGSGDLLGPVLRYAGELVLQASRAAGRFLLRQAETPGHPLHHMYQYKPMSLAEHHAYANSREGAARFQLHTAGKALVSAGHALSALGESVAGPWIALAVTILAAIAITVLVL